MGALYNISEISNITSPLLIGNELMGGMLFGHLLLLTIFLVTMFGISGSRGGDIISGSQLGAVFAFITNILLLPLNIVSPVPIVFWLVIMIGGLFFSGTRN